ncbi:MAG: cyclodeaminase/cyclohydrolase family protein [Rhizobiales bacterium]|nr:cyclodeaminase/cyclohydrolase family protein [Hyphomicrobiales bacterium]
MSANELASIDRTIADYAARVASSSPTPGGGSVAGMVGAFAAALAGMVCALTLGGAKDLEAGRLLESAQQKTGELRERLLRLAVDDEAAFAGYRAASALPKSTPVEKSHRNEAIQSALIDACDAPMAIARACLDVLTLLPRIAQHGTKHALSDASASAILANAALRSALLNIDVNADLIKKQSVTARLRSESARLEADGRALSAQTLALIASRQA